MYRTAWYIILLTQCNYMYTYIVHACTYPVYDFYIQVYTTFNKTILSIMWNRLNKE